MTRIFEALERASAEQKSYTKVIDFPVHDSPSPNEFEHQRLLSLHRSICARSEEKSGGRIIHLLGIERRAGTGRLLRALAHVVSNVLGRSVLILDADQSAGQISHFRVSPALDWAELICSGNALSNGVYRIGRSNLYVSQAFRDPASADVFLDPVRSRPVVERAREMFDLVLVDSAPTRESEWGVVLSSLVDGSVLVLESERTRWQVANAVKEAIGRQGGNLLGVVLNNYRYYIPEFVYKHL